MSITLHFIEKPVLRSFVVILEAWIDPTHLVRRQFSTGQQLTRLSFVKHYETYDTNSYTAA